jgi:RNA polymerase sigma factor (sigma-70 family)
MSNAALAAGVRQLRGLAAAQSRPHESDEQLLSAFITRHDENAFAVLVRRYGPLVAGVCRRVLRHEQDAEDAFQATFLVLARRAAALRNKTALPSFLHGTAYRMALMAKRTAARRHKHENRAPTRSSDNPSDRLLWREVQALLDEEIARLPERFRSVFVLCCLESLGRTETARRLGLKEGTVSSRLAEARRRLQRRLSRRGVELTALLAATALTTEAMAALPARLLGQTTRAAVTPAVAALAAQELSRLGMGKIQLAMLVLAASLLAGAGLWAYYGAGATPHPSPPPQGGGESLLSPSPLVGEGWGGGKAKDKAVEIRGRVLDPDGKPFAGARLLLRSDAAAKKTDLLVRATTDKDGFFRFTAKATDFNPQGKATLAATAERLGPDWIEVTAKPNRDVTLRLVKDDVPIEGRILDLEGRPRAGVRVHVVGLTRGDLNAWMKVVLAYTSAIPKDINSDILGASASALSGKDGRFRLTGIGRERGVELTIRGPGIEWARLWAVTRPGPARGWRSGQEGLYGATFDWLAGPCKPITGTVRDKATGKPVEGLHVSSGNTLGATVLTDRQGRYRLNGVGKRGSYSVGAWGVPYLDSWRDDVPDTTGLEPLVVDFQVQCGLAITGHLLDKKTKKPVQGWVQYLAFADNPNRKNFTLRNGLFTSFNDVVGRTKPDGSFQVIALPGPGLLSVRTDEADRYPGIRPDPRLLAKVGSLLELNVYQALVRIDPSESDRKSTTCDILLEPVQKLRGNQGLSQGEMLLLLRHWAGTITW